MSFTSEKKMKKVIAAVSLSVLFAATSVYAENDTINGDVGAINNSNADASADNAVGSSFVDMTFEAAKMQPYMPGTVSAPVLSPTLFSIMGKPAQIAGLPVLSQYFFSTSLHDVEVGRSGKTKVIFNGEKLPERKRLKNRKVKFDFNGIATGKVVGSLTVQSRKKSSDEVDLPSVIYDATHYIACSKAFEGYNVLLLSIPDLISYAVGVDASSRGVSVAPVVSGLINGPLGALTGLSTGLSNTGGVTAPTALVGCTFLIVAEDESDKPINLAQCFGRSPITERVNKDKDVVDGAANDGAVGKQYESTRPEASK
ncbi:hypothetical protein [Chlorobium sp. N1]|uniref:hypothetical protein n=1 Tax=Chlorobium sp. N1 TaxID=2491138 RepID=UPI001040A5E6|nr:hypothetical protein [Chlorobium sp. N1]TCD47284.1 hypothetical protein E0L29_08300 [Chlorobium sp. N1]